LGLFTSLDMELKIPKRLLTLSELLISPMCQFIYKTHVFQRILTLALTAICACPARRTLTSKTPWVIHTGSTILTQIVFACCTFVDICEKKSSTEKHRIETVDHLRLLRRIWNKQVFVLFKPFFSSFSFYSLILSVNTCFFPAVLTWCFFQFFNFRVGNPLSNTHVSRPCQVSECIWKNLMASWEKLTGHAAFSNTY